MEFLRTLDEIKEYIESLSNDSFDFEVRNDKIHFRNTSHYNIKITIKALNKTIRCSTFADDKANITNILKYEIKKYLINYFNIDSLGGENHGIN